MGIGQCLEGSVLNQTCNFNAKRAEPRVLSPAFPAGYLLCE